MTAVGAMLLTPGAGAGRDNRTLVALERALTPLPCARIDFPYRIAGKRMPDRAPVAVAHVRAEAHRLAAEHELEPDRVVLGGRSYGGRMCSMAVAEGLPAAGLVLLSYPLHPPGQPAKLRIEHLPQITVPVLTISGRNDPFGTPDELAHHFSVVPGPLTQLWVAGDHSPNSAEKEITGMVKEWIQELV